MQVYHAVSARARDAPNRTREWRQNASTSRGWGGVALGDRSYTNLRGSVTRPSLGTDDHRRVTKRVVAVQSRERHRAVTDDVT